MKKDNDLDTFVQMIHKSDHEYDIVKHVQFEFDEQKESLAHIDNSTYYKVSIDDTVEFFFEEDGTFMYISVDKHEEKD